jgi:serine/threonine-protein kinase
MLGETVGKYHILDRIGRGSMGTVYRAEDKSLHRDVAIKVLNADLNDPAAGRRFRAEAIAVARLNHPGIAKVYDLFEHDGQWLMAMEFVKGETLESLVGRGGLLPANTAADLTSQALMALAHAHGMGVIHRDLKPANLMVADGRIKITDFGIARVAGTEHLTSAGLRMGTPAFMAPEQVLGHDIDARTDIFAMGCVMFFLATGSLPFKGDTPMEIIQARLQSDATPIRTIRHELPAWFAQIVECALARDPASRFQTADAFHQVIERGLAGLPLNLPTPSSLMETMLPGSMPVAPPAPVVREEAPVAPTVKTPAVPEFAPTERVDRSTHTQTQPASSKARSPVVLIAGAVILFGAAGLAIKYWAGSSSAPATSSEPAQPAATSVPPVTQGTDALQTQTTPTVPPAATPLTSSPATSNVTTTATPPASTPTPTPGPAGRGTDTPVVFDTVKLLKITGSKGDDVDATLTVGGMSIVVSPRPGRPLVMNYRTLAAVTFTKDRFPRTAPNLSGPPADLDLSRNALLRRPVRNWLALQSKTEFLILALADADAEQILKTIGDRSRIKITR